MITPQMTGRKAATKNGDVGLIVAVVGSRVHLRMLTGSYMGCIIQVTASSVDALPVAPRVNRSNLSPKAIDGIFDIAIRKLAEQQRKMQEMLIDYCPSDNHMLVQYRDGKPAHCPHCKRDANGIKHD